MFVHLRLHTEFSVVDGTNRIDEIVKAAAADGQPALGITDLNNLFGAIKFYKEARGKGVKPVIGAELMVQGLAKDPTQISRLIVLVQSRQGYLNLCELLARAWTGNAQRTQAWIKWDWLAELGGGLIALSGADLGAVGQALLAAKAGATYISPFIGRLDDHGANGMDLITEIRAIYDNYDFDTEILAASIRTPAHVTEAALAGADCATIPPDVFLALFKHPLTERGLQQFMADWAKTGQSIL